MIRTPTRLLGAAAALALAGCASAPMHYYTLMPPAAEPADAPVAAADQGLAGLPFELLPVSVPAQVDVPQLVLREGGQSVAMLEGERWIAPLGSEVRGALSADLARQLHSQDVRPAGQPAATAADQAGSAPFRFAARRLCADRGQLERARAARRARWRAGLQQPRAGNRGAGL